MALSSFVRRISGSNKFPLPIRFTNVQNQKDNYNYNIGKQLIPYLRFSTTSIETEVVRILESDDCDLTQVASPPELEIVVVESDILAARGKYNNDIIDIETDLDQITDPTEEKVCFVGDIIRGYTVMRANFEVDPHKVYIEDFHLSELRDYHLKDFEKFLDIRGINSDLNKFLWERYLETVKPLVRPTVFRRRYNFPQSLRNNLLSTIHEV